MIRSAAAPIFDAFFSQVRVGSQLADGIPGIRASRSGLQSFVA